MRPDVVFMDEPSKSLDPVAASAMRSYLKWYAEEGRAALLVTTHNMKEAEEISDKVVMINRGEVLFQGTPEEMKTSVMKTEVIEIGGNNLGQEMWSSMVNIPGVLDIQQEGANVRLYCNDAYGVLPQVLYLLKDNGQKLPVGIEHLTLEEAFKIMVRGDRAE